LLLSDRRVLRLFAAALREANALFQLPENMARMEEAVARAGDDPVRRMTLLLPVVEGEFDRLCAA
jgi:hypothetical protein